MALTKVTSGVIAANAVVDSFGTQSITGDKIGLTAINANNIVNASITGNKYGLQSISANAIVNGTITGDKYGLTSINANNIVNASITGNKIGVGQITANLFASDVVATQANQETATSTTTIVTPGRQQFHPSAAKAWIKCDFQGIISVSYNVASIADTGTGVVTVTLTTAFSSSNYVPICANDCGGGGLFAGASITSASVYRLLAMNTVTQAPQDSGVYFSAAFGDQ